MPKSKPEDDFFRLVCGSGYPPPERNYRFANKTHQTATGRPRQWRFDFAWLDSKLAVEIEGGSGMMRPCPSCGENVRMGGRHHTAEGFANDCEKYLAAIELGWQVVRMPSNWVRDGKAMKALRRVLTFDED